MHMGEVGNWFGSIVDGIKEETGISANPLQSFVNVIYQRFNVDLSQTFNKITPGGLVGPSYTPQNTTTVSRYGYAGDSTPDPNSSVGRGAFPPYDKAGSLVPLSEQSYKNGTVSLAISPSLAQGLNQGQKITVRLASGQTITGIYADKTSPDFPVGSGNTLYRVDVYDPNNQINSLPGIGNLDGAQVNSINGSADSAGKPITWQDVVSNPNESLQAMLFGLFTLILAYVAASVMWLSAVLQSVVYDCMIAVGPIFAGFLVIRGLENIAKTFILGFVAVSLFPIGFLLAGLVTQFLIGMALNPALNGVTGGAADNIIGAGMLWIILTSLWVLFSSFFAPFIIAKAFSSVALGLDTLVISSARGLQTTSHTATQLSKSTSQFVPMIRGNGSRPTHATRGDE
jgi:hypothetical protein